VRIEVRELSTPSAGQLRIGEFARRAGVNLQTIRYYERLKLLHAPSRTRSGYRCYSFAELERVRFIKTTQELGFTLKEIGYLLPLHSSVCRITACDGVDSRELTSIVTMFAKKQLEIEAKIALLRDLQGQLVSAIAALSRRPAPACPASRSARRAAPE
jgi:MerR family transcriptional regulator, mercuric resistance operon regulatory protein